MSTIRPEFSTSLVSRTIEDILFRRSNFFYFLGKINDWSGTHSSSESDTYASDTSIRDNILYMKKVSPNDTSLVIKRYNWVTGQVWDQWDQTQIMIGKKFYVVNSQFNVYKCLNNKGGVVSTVQPTGTSTSPFLTADGYLWKYMYNIPAFKQQKFVTADYIPVQKALTDTFYSKGAVQQAVLINGGSGYTSTPQTTITAVGGTTGDTALLIPVINSLGEIVKVTIARGGTLYTSAPTLTVNQVGSAGSGKYGNATAVLKAIIYNGAVVNVTIEDPGKNYPRDIATQITVTGDGSGATFIPVVYNGSIIDVILDNPGYGYNQISLTVTGTGTSASVNAILAQSDFVSDQSYVEQTTVPGAIYSIVVSQAGNNYSNTTAVTIVGDGTGAQAEPIISDGSISGIRMTSYGSGYTYANVVISDPARITTPTTVDASSYAILPPFNGHGYDAVKEFFADSLCIYTSIRNETELNLIAQDYRQYGLIKNPIDVQTNRIITTPANMVAFTVSVDSTANIAIDSILLNNNVRYRVAYKTSTNIVLQQLSSIYKVPQGVLVAEANPAQTYVIRNLVSSSTLNKYSGNLLYAANNDPLTPNAQQAITVRTVIKL
jgi:hypothetical protein